MPEFTIETELGDSITIEANQMPNAQDVEQIINHHRQIEAKNFKPREFSSPLAMTREEWDLQQQRDDAKSFSQKAGEFVSGVGQGILQLLRLGANSIGEVGGAIAAGDIERIGKTGAEGVARAVFDLGELGEAISGRVGDIFVSDEEAKDRQFRRYRQDILDQEKRRQGLLFSQEEVLPSATEVGSFALDPTNLIGLGVGAKIGKVAGLGSKAQKVLDAPNKAVRAALDKGVRLTAGATGKTLQGASKVLDKPLGATSSVLGATGRVAGLPRDAVNTMLTKVLGADEKTIKGLTGFGGALTNPLTQAEIGLKAGSGLIGGVSGAMKDAGTILSILSDTDRQFRFLRQAMLDPNVSQKTKKLLSVAGTGTQKGLDLAFNAAANGITTGALQGILAKMATDDPEAIGSAVGMGLLFGGAIPTGKNAPIKSLASDRAFWDLQRSLASKEAASKLSDADKALYQNLAKSGVDMEIHVFDKQTFKDHFIADQGTQPKKSDAWFQDEHGALYINAEAKNATNKVVQELGTRIARDLVDRNPDLKNRIKSELDPDGNLDINTLIDKQIETIFGDLLGGNTTSGKIKSNLGKNPETLEVAQTVLKTTLSRLGLLDTNGNIKTELKGADARMLKNPFLSRLSDNYTTMRNTIVDQKKKVADAEAKRISNIRQKAEKIQQQGIANYQKRKQQIAREKDNARIAKEKAKNREEKEAIDREIKMLEALDKINNKEVERKRALRKARDDAEVRAKEQAQSLRERRLEEIRRRNAVRANQEIREAVRVEKGLKKAEDATVKAEQELKKIEKAEKQAIIDEEIRATEERIKAEQEQAQNELKTAERNAVGESLFRLNEKQGLTPSKAKKTPEKFGGVEFVSLPDKPNTKRTREGVKKYEIHKNAISATKRNTGNEVRKRKTSRGEQFIGTRAGNAVIDAMPKRNLSAVGSRLVSPKKALERIDLALKDGLKMFADVITTGATEKKLGVERSPRDADLVIGEFSPLQLLIPKDPDPAKNPTILQAQILDYGNARLILDENRNVIANRQGDINSIISQDYSDFMRMNKAVNDAGAVAVMPEMQNNVVALMWQQNNMKKQIFNVENIPQLRRLAIKSIDPNFVIDIGFVQ